MRSLRSILAAALVVLMIGLSACGGEDGVVTHRALQPADLPGLPNATVEAIRGCASRAEHHKGDVFAFQFNAEVTESGHVDRVRLNDSYPRNAGLESCLASAIERMQIPPFVVQKVLEQAGAVSPESRGLLGNPLVLVALLLESSVVVDEATFMVALTVAAAHDVIEAVRQKTRVKNKCMDLMHECLKDGRQPDWNRKNYGNTKDCLSCQSECVHEKGKWPDYKCPPSKN